MKTEASFLEDREEKDEGGSCFFQSLSITAERPAAEAACQSLQKSLTVNKEAQGEQQWTQ